MASPLSEMQIGSPLPNSSDAIARQILDGQIEILSGSLELHGRSTVTLRNTEQLGLNMLNGSWSYTPKYMYENKHQISYLFGLAQNPEDGGYNELLKALSYKAEQEFLFAPLRQVRSFLLNHDKITGRTNLRMPDDWTVVVDDSLKMTDFMGIIEGYVQSEQRQAVASVIFEQFYAASRDTTVVNVRLLFSEGRLTIMDNDRPIQGADMLFNMTPIIKFISRPWNHGLTQEHFRAYRKLVNL